MVPPPEFLYLLQITVAVILAALMGIATIVWFVKMWGVGGIAGNYFTLFFACIMMYAISSVLMILTPSTSNETATFWGVLAYTHGFIGWFLLFLAGEYSVTDRPRPMRVMVVGTCYGISLGGFIYTLLNPTSNILLNVTNITGFGWVVNVSLFFLLTLVITCLFSLSLFFQFCYKAFRSAPNTRFGKRVRKLLVTLSSGLVLDLSILGIGWFYENFEELSIICPIIAMACTSGFLVIALILVFQEYRIIYFMPHKAIGIIVLTTEGIVCFDHSFQKAGVSKAIHELLGPALTAINNLVQETLELNAIEWVRELRTDKMTFLLDVRPQYDLIGLLVVSKATRILRKSFGTFMDVLMAFYEKSGGELCDTPHKEKVVHEICIKAFPYIPPPD